MEKIEDAEEEKIERLMKIIKNMNLNAKGPNISKEELIKMRNDLKYKKKEDKSIIKALFYIIS